MTQPYQIDKSRFPYVLRNSIGKPVLAVYDMSLTETLAQFPLIVEEWRQLKRQNGTLIEVDVPPIVTEEPDSHQPPLPMPIPQDPQVVVKRESAPRSAAPSKPTEPPKELPETIEVDQVWMTRKGYPYKIISIDRTKQEVTISWTQGSDKRKMPLDNLIKNYLYNPEA